MTHGVIEYKKARLLGRENQIDSYWLTRLKDCILRFY